MVLVSSIENVAAEIMLEVELMAEIEMNCDADATVV